MRERLLKRFLAWWDRHDENAHIAVASAAHILAFAGVGVGLYIGTYACYGPGGLFHG